MSARCDCDRRGHVPAQPRVEPIGLDDYAVDNVALVILTIALDPLHLARQLQPRQRVGGLGELQLGTGLAGRELVALRRQPGLGLLELGLGRAPPPRRACDRMQPCGRLVTTLRISIQARRAAEAAGYPSKARRRGLDQAAQRPSYPVARPL